MVNCVYGPLQIYQWLQLSPKNTKRPDIKSLDSSVEVIPCQLGQPVFIGSHEGQSFSALRICLSARLIVKGVANNWRDIIQEALLALDNVSLLIKMLPTDN